MTLAEAVAFFPDRESVLAYARANEVRGVPGSCEECLVAAILVKLTEGGDVEVFDGLYTNGWLTPAKELPAPLADVERAFEGRNLPEFEAAGRRG